MEKVDFQKWLTLLLAEVFGVSGTPHGYILDDGNLGLIGTINTLSAEVASTVRAPEHLTIAAHCGHVLFLLRFFEAYGRGETPEADWPGSWSTRVVDEAEWATLRDDLQIAYNAVIARLQGLDTWPEAAVAASMMLLSHCAFHVGQVRQLLTFVAE